MSFFGSPVSNSFNQDLDYEEDRFDDDDDRDNDESDEDTADASETDTGRQNEPLEIKEQMYQDKLANLKRKLQQLKDGTHYEYNKKVKKLEYQYKERLRLNTIYKEYMTECLNRDYVQEIEAAKREFEEKKIDLRETLISDLEDKKRTIEAERFSMELTGDSMEVKPAMTRKLRRRPNDPPPAPEKRRKPANGQLQFLLDEREAEADLRLILSKGRQQQPSQQPIRKEGANIAPPTSPVSSGGSSAHRHAPTVQNSGGGTSGAGQTVTGGEMPLIETRIEDGKLLYEKRWFHRGQSIFVEGRDMPKFPANISAIGNDCIWVKKPDGSKTRFFVSNLARGKISIKRRAS